MAYYDSIYNDQELGHRAKAVYIYLKDHANKEGACWPGIKTIAAGVSLSRSTVKRALDDLMKVGLVVKSSRQRENGSLTSKQVYFRYDPDDLSEVRVYDLEDRYIMTAPVDNTAVLTYGASREDVKEAMGKVRRMERLTKEALKVSAYPAFGKRTALELVMEQAYQSKTARIVPSADPKVLELQRPDEEPLLRAVAGGPDLDVMNRNALKRKGGSEHE